MNDHNNNSELLDFLAEKFLEQQKSITYTNVGGYPALKVASEQASATYLPLAPEEVSVQFLEKLKLTVIIAVVEEEEQSKLGQLLQRNEFTNIEINRLTFKKRYSFYSRKHSLSKMAN